MVQVRIKQTNKFRRDAWLEINLANLEFNIKSLYSEFRKPLIPILKADAYGHGASVIVQVLDAYDFVYAYGLASIDEALALRELSSKPIIVLGISPEWAVEQAIENDIELTVVSSQAAHLINEKARSLKLQAKIHLKIDTGMNRIGFRPETFYSELNEIKKLDNIVIKSLFTHFADVDDKEFSLKQKSLFEELTKTLPYPKHLASSKAARLFQDFDSDYLRCGIELYGLETTTLKPLLSLYSRVSFVKNIKAGESVSYKRTWIADSDTRIITLPLGYADGIPRVLSNKISAYYKNQKIRQVGIITMDQIMFDAGKLNINEGEIIELIGKNSSVEEWAEKAGTISYEIVSNLSLRLPKTYTR